MRVLVACEFSGIVRDAFIAKGHDAVSCDLLPTEAPGPHIQGDALETARSQQWDLMIAHPPCTYLCSSGLHWNKRRPGRAADTACAIVFAVSLMDCDIPRIAMENPIGCLSSRYRKPDQIIQPWQFGEDASKSTCLWLKGLPILRPSRIVDPRLVCCGRRIPEGVGKYGCPNCGGERTPKPRWANQTDSGQNKLGPSESRAAERSRTYRGISEAMAEQWGSL